MKNNLIYNITTYLLIFTVLFSINSVKIFAEEQTSTPQIETNTDQREELPVHNPETPNIELNSKAAVLIDATTGAILFEKNANEKMYPASITKILTGYLAAQNGNLEDTITVSQKAVDTMGEGGSNIGLVPGEKITLEDGLYGVMLESANEVCGAIAEHISGSIEEFVNLMNKTAQEVGAKNTHFANPHGFHNDNHYTTAYDMALITKLALTNSDFELIWGTPSHKIPETNLNVERYLNHKDKMLRSSSEFFYPDILGGKTGFTDEAGNTLVSYAERDNAKIIAVVLKADDRNQSYNDTTKLLDYGFSLYDEIDTIISQQNYKITKDVFQTYKDKTYRLGSVNIGVLEDFQISLPKFIKVEDIKISPEIEENLKAPVLTDDIVGKINLHYNNTLIHSMDAVALNDANALSDKELAKRELKDNLKKYVAIPFVVLVVIVLVFSLICLIKSIFNKITGKSKKRRKKQVNRQANRPPNRTRQIQQRKPSNRPPSKKAVNNRQVRNLPNRNQRPKRHSHNK